MSRKVLLCVISTDSTAWGGVYWYVPTGATCQPEVRSMAECRKARGGQGRPRAVGIADSRGSAPTRRSMSDLVDSKLLRAGTYYYYEVRSMSHPSSLSLCHARSATHEITLACLAMISSTASVISHRYSYCRACVVVQLPLPVLS